MTLKQIECFLHLSENLNFARTADELFISQPAVSREIKALETELGVTLFIRTKRSVTLTPAGSCLKVDLGSLYSSINDAVTKARNAQKNFYQQLNFGFCHTTSLLRLPEGLKEFHKLHPNIYLRPVTGELRSLNVDFQAGKLDILFGMKDGLTPRQSDGYDLIYKGRLCIVVPEGHELYHRNALTLEDLDGHTLLSIDKQYMPPLIGKVFREILAACPHSVLANVPNIEEARILLLSGLGISLAPQYSFAPSSHYKMIPLEHPALNNTDVLDYYVCYHQNDNRKHIKRFISIIKALHADM